MIAIVSKNSSVNHASSSPLVTRTNAIRCIVGVNAKTTDAFEHSVDVSFAKSVAIPSSSAITGSLCPSSCQYDTMSSPACTAVDINASTKDSPNYQRLHYLPHTGHNQNEKDLADDADEEHEPITVELDALDADDHTPSTNTTLENTRFASSSAKQPAPS